MPVEKRIDRTLTGWSNSTQNTFPELSAKLREQPDPYLSAKTKGLPVPPYLFFNSPRDFFKSPERHFQSLREQGVTNFFASLRPKHAGLEKFRQFDLASHRDVINFIDIIQPIDYDKYHLMVAEYRTAVFGGIMVINPTGEFVMELVKGEMQELATGLKTPEYEVTRNPYTNLFHYSSSFAGTDSRLIDGIVAIFTKRLLFPEEATSSIRIRDAYFNPADAGYYEYSFPSRDGDTTKQWDTVFFDYKNDP